MKKVNIFLLGIYVWFVLFVYKITLSGLEDVFVLFLSLVFTGGVAFLIASLAYRWVSNISLYNSNFEADSVMVNRWKHRLIFFVLITGWFLLWYAAYYPGYFSNDSIGQLSQAIGGGYNDWHPYLQTIFTFTIPLKLTGGWFGSIALFQIIWFAAALSYMGEVLLRYGGKKFAITMLVLIVLNPFTDNIVLFPWKDVAFGGTAMLALSFALEVYMTKGEWLKQVSHFIGLSLALALCTLFRHNAILFTVPVLIGIMFFSSKKYFARVLITFAVFVFFVKFPLALALQVDKADSRLIETTGLPLTIIGNVVVEASDRLDDETKEFVYSIATQEAWEQYYVCGSFNSLKWSGSCNWEAIDNSSLGTILRITAKCIIQEPIASIKAFVALTDQNYAIGGNIEGTFGGYIAANGFGLERCGNERLRSIWDDWSGFVTKSVLQYIFCFVGTWNLFIITVILSKMHLNNKNDWKKLFLGGAILVHNYATMLLLSGSDARYFYLTFLIAPLVALLYLPETPANKGEIGRLEL